MESCHHPVSRHQPNKYLVSLCTVTVGLDVIAIQLSLPVLDLTTPEPYSYNFRWLIDGTDDSLLNKVVLEVIQKKTYVAGNTSLVTDSVNYKVCLNGKRYLLQSYKYNIEMDRNISHWKSQSACYKDERNRFTRIQTRGCNFICFPLNLDGRLLHSLSVFFPNSSRIGCRDHCLALRRIDLLWVAVATNSLSVKKLATLGNSSNACASTLRVPCNMEWQLE